MSRKYYKPFDRGVSENKSSLGGFENQVATVKEVDDKPTETKKDVKEIKNKMEQQINKASSTLWRDAKTNVLCNMRSEPSMDSNVLEVLSQGTIIKITNNQGDFYKVDHNNKIGYIKKDLVTKD